MIRLKGVHHIGSGLLAVAVHALFALGLVIGLGWQSRPDTPVYVELWSDVPADRPAAAAVTDPAIPAAEPPQPAPPTVPQATPPAAEPQIDLKPGQPRQPQPHAKTRTAAETVPARREQTHQQPIRREPRPEPIAQDDDARQDKWREFDEELTRQAMAELEREAGQLRRYGVWASMARQRMLEDYREHIRGKILSHLRLPPNLVGNPEVVYRVRLLPDGEVLRLTLVRSSGQPAYDKQVELAILRASPLPLPPDRELAALFREELILKFRPSDTGDV